MMTISLTWMTNISASLDNLQAQMDGLGSRLQHQTERWRRIQQAFDHIPQLATIAGSAKTSTTGYARFTCRGPDRGRMWEVRRLAIGGLTTGKARFYISATPPLTTGKQVTGLFDRSTTWPLNCATYSTRTVVVVPPQKLWVVVITGTHTATVQVYGAADDYTVAAYTTVTEL